VSKGVKPAKIVSLIVLPRRDCARPLKEKEIFAGFVYSAFDGMILLSGPVSKILWILLKESSNFVQNTEPKSTRGVKSYLVKGV